MAPEPETTVPDCVSTFVSMKLMDIFRRGDISSCVCSNKTGYFCCYNIN